MVFGIVLAIYSWKIFFIFLIGSVLRITSYNVCYTKLLRHNPQLLILDEPFTGFDPINQQEIRELIFSFVSEGKIIILSTHQMETAEKLCADIFLLNKGKEVTSGKLSDIKKEFGGKHVEIKFNGDLSVITSYSIHYTKLYDGTLFNH